MLIFGRPPGARVTASCKSGALVRAYADLIRAGRPPVTDDSPIAGHVYAEETTEDGPPASTARRYGPTVHLDYARGTHTAVLVESGWSETAHRADDADGSLAAFATAYTRRCSCRWLPAQPRAPFFGTLTQASTTLSRENALPLRYVR